jgi:Zn-finger nucleic acid-binding protein
MQCPTDKSDLVMSERSGVEIDYCPKCRGVWLDRGELDKIIERSVEVPSTASTQTQYNDRRESYPSHGSNDDRQNGKRRKKEGFLGELFDF